MTIEQQAQLEVLFDEIKTAGYLLADAEISLGPGGSDRHQEWLDQLLSTFADRVMEIIQPIPQFTLD